MRKIIQNIKKKEFNKRTKSQLIISKYLFFKKIDLVIYYEMFSFINE